MGAWGEGPVDNDTALDFIDGVMKRCVKPGLGSENPNRVRAAASIIKKLRYFHMYEEAEEALNKVRENLEWLQEWCDPAEVDKLLINEIMWFEREK